MDGGVDSNFNNSKQEDSNVRVNKGPTTMQNGAIYTGEWLNGMRDGEGGQLWPDGSRY